MKVKILLILVLSVTTLTAFAQDGGVRGRVVSRAGRVALDGVKVTMTPGDVTVMSDERGNFLIENVPAGEYSLQFETPEFEPLSIAVRVGSQVRDINAVVLVPDVPRQMIDDAVFAEFDMETVDDAQALPTSLSASKDIFNNIASYKFSEMRFNVRGYDSQYQDVYMNGIRLNDALTGYTPWSLWSGLNDATRNQEVTSGIVASDGRAGRHRRYDQHHHQPVADAQGVACQPRERQFDVPFPCNGHLCLGLSGQRLVVCLFGFDPPGRQLLCRRRLLQCVRLFRRRRKAVRPAPPPGADPVGCPHRTRCATGRHAGGLRPGRQQLLQPQLGLAGRQEAQCPRA